MRTTKPVPKTSKFAKWWCDWTRGHCFSINEIVPMSVPWTDAKFYSFCRFCGYKERWWLSYWPICHHVRIDGVTYNQDQKGFAYEENIDAQ